MERTNVHQRTPLFSTISDRQNCHAILVPGVQCFFRPARNISEFQATKLISSAGQLRQHRETYGVSRFPDGLLREQGSI